MEHHTFVVIFNLYSFKAVTPHNKNLNHPDLKHIDEELQPNTNTTMYFGIKNTLISI